MNAHQFTRKVSIITSYGLLIIFGIMLFSSLAMRLNPTKHWLILWGIFGFPIGIDLFFNYKFHIAKYEHLWKNYPKSFGHLRSKLFYWFVASFIFI